MKKDLTNAQVSILLEIDGQVHLVGFEKELLETITSLVKIAANVAVPTGKSQVELREFLNCN
ncbi:MULTISPECIES: hypothetical protein [Lysinibacillus]|jgi:hypothetical protein|uniref:hypothetical protein n=1 Tax=Lysinibacillus TaxID=400634 RepID=UPI0004D46437|nr:MULTISPECIES: hypothetical protein [Lysinibacillus]AJK87665.1 hypothetical protein HR49_11065 [Lysinibacillus fusiformis]KHK48769.1 hypothetical protein PI85_21755 [Lysinibacillus sp. A1]